jgi:asparagine synthase (glutamine-hydrolysing)
MCGIVAVTSSNNHNLQILKPLATISHRGPDGSNIFVSPKGETKMGHVRLAILDLTEHGAQPMSDISQRFTICFNGQIYNYLELLYELESKYGIINWKSKTDTEIILEGFSREGYHFFTKLNGIFVILIYDNQTEELHILRDPIGVKPLYYSEQNGAVYCSSELKGICAFDNINTTINQTSLFNQLQFTYVPEPNTMYQEISKIEKGTYCILKNGKFLIRKKIFQTNNFITQLQTESNYIENFRSTFSSAVRRQLQSDVPISILLSGGIDSASVLSQIQNFNPNLINHAYTISYHKNDHYYDRQSSDLKFAKILASKYGINLKVIEADSNYLSILPKLIPFMEDGISDPAAITTYILCSAARNDGYKVILTGQGSDEYLCGYRRYKAESLIQKMSPLTKYILKKLGDNTPISVPGFLNAPLRRLRKISTSINLPIEERLPNYFYWVNKPLLNSLFKENLIEKQSNCLENFFLENTGLDSLNALLLADQQFDLLSLNLSYTDKMSMAVGVEARVPFLDLELVKFMNSVPINLKYNNGKQKYILKKAMENVLPSKIINRSKAGFGLPIRSWFRQDQEIFNYYFDESRIERQGIFHPYKIKEILNHHFSKKQDYSYLIFSMLCQQMWIDHHNKVL